MILMNVKFINRTTYVWDRVKIHRDHINVRVQQVIDWAQMVELAKV